MRMNVTFITGNQSKADALAAWLGFEIAHQKLELDEIQSVDMKEIAEHKARQAYDILQSPVLIEDVGLSFNALGGLPGPYIKWFVEYTGLSATAKMLDGFSDKSATATCTWAYFDGKNIEFIEGLQHGSVAPEPLGNGGWGWDAIFIPDGNTITRGEMSPEQYEKSYTDSKNYPALREFLTNL
jgi:non-canonical purine NTP pyrophosphatase (RdgB/HAM1 family)